MQQEEQTTAKHSSESQRQRDEMALKLRLSNIQDELIRRGYLDVKMTIIPTVNKSLDSIANEVAEGLEAILREDVSPFTPLGDEQGMKTGLLDTTKAYTKNTPRT